MNSAARYILSKRFIMATRRPVNTARISTTRFVSGGSDSITYSGGQATEGQGGFYGSGGARAQAGAEQAPDDANRRQLLALAADVDKITTVMEEIYDLQESLTTELQQQQEQQGSSSVTSKTMEIKNAIKKRLTAPDVIESLNRLEVEGQPTWGLSTKERELIMAAREKMNES